MSEDATGQSRIEAQVQQVMRALTDQGDLPVGPDELEREVRGRVTDWQDARVQDFVPLFVERRLREELGGRSRAS